MRGATFVLSVMLVLASCTKKKERKLKPGADCTEAIANLLKVGLTAQGRDLKKLSDSKREGLVMIGAAMRDHCKDDKWSREAIECFAGGETQDNLGACKGTMTPEQEKAMEGVVGEVESGAYERKRLERVKDEVAAEQNEKNIVATKDMLGKLVASYPKWKDFTSNMHQTCPDSALTLIMTDHELRSEDPWGHDYRVLCGDKLPAGAKELGIVSDGPDGKPDTADDLKSW